MLAAGAPLYGWIAGGYWEDIGNAASYLRAQADVLNRAVNVDIDGFEMSSGVWIADGAEVDPGAALTGPLHIGSYAKVEAGAVLREYTVLGSNVVVKGGALLERAVVHDNAYIGPQAALRGCVIGKRTDIMRAVQVAEGVIVGDDCVVEEEAILGDGVAVYPSKVIDAGTVQNQSVIWESRGQRALFGQRGVSGLVNVEITPELCVRLATAYATTLRKGEPGDGRPGRLASRPGLQAGGHQRADGERHRGARPRGLDDADHPLGRPGLGFGRRDHAAYLAG